MGSGGWVWRTLLSLPRVHSWVLLPLPPASHHPGGCLLTLQQSLLWQHSHHSPLCCCGKNYGIQLNFIHAFMCHVPCMRTLISLHIFLGHRLQLSCDWRVVDLGRLSQLHGWDATPAHQQRGRVPHLPPQLQPQPRGGVHLLQHHLRCGSCSCASNVSIRMKYHILVYHTSDSAKSSNFKNTLIL